MDNPQENIVIAASRLFEQFGIRSVSIDNVCNELRISKKTFYTYFPQKEDLVEAVLELKNRSKFEKFEKIFKDRNAIDSLILIIKEIKKSLESDSQTMFYDLEKYYPKVFEKHISMRTCEIRNGFELNLRQGIAEGYYRDDLDVELISLFHSIQIKHTFEIMQQSPKKFTKKRLVDFFIDLMIHLIANEKGLKYMEENNNKAE
jgi:TetR/AcrR family transcriptional regulator, cholesterol catabolism regulator